MALVHIRPITVELQWLEYLWLVYYGCFELSLESLWKVVGWMVGCFGFNGPLRQYFSLYRTGEREKEERKDRRE